MSFTENVDTTVPSAAEPFKPQRSSEWARFWKKFRRSKPALPGGIIVAIIVFCGLFAPWIAPYDPFRPEFGAMLEGPSWAHLFGRDELGRDLLSRVIHGARISLLEGVLSVALAMSVGVPLGVVAAFFGGKLDIVLMRVIDVMLAFPGVLLAIVIVSILGPSLTNTMIAVAVYTIPIFTRIARSATLALMKEPYIEAARSMGMRNGRIMLRHILPNITGEITVMATLRIGIAVLTASSLSFLGLGAQAPTPEWGSMLASGRNYMLIAPHIVIFPGLAILFLVLGLNLLQDGLRIALDPKSVDP
ncbi:ABC transporter permease [Bosea sp. Root381]|uniref:ABC transporter permease n=1 Tax=Bosea sp. Root381 TaxID=1736524 RepID=UPI0009EA9521|nr:ABC transporter permease [Bosea sp. Root381]